MKKEIPLLTVGAGVLLCGERSRMKAMLFMIKTSMAKMTVKLWGQCLEIVLYGFPHQLLIPVLTPTQIGLG